MELAPNEVIDSPADYLTSCSYSEGEDEFPGYPFSQTEQQIPDLRPIEKSSKLPWKYFPMVDIEILASTYFCVESARLMERMLSSRHLDKQQRFVIENTILSSQNIQHNLHNIIYRHFLSVILVLLTWIFSFYLFLTLLSLFCFFLISQIRRHTIFHIFTIKRSFTNIYKELSKFEELIDDLSTALKLLTQIHIMEKATFNLKTNQHQNIFTINKLKQHMTNVYSNSFFHIQTITNSLPLQNIPFGKDELICTLEKENILERIYHEVPEKIHEMCFTKMSLDTFKIWHCLLTCQFGEFIQILVSNIDHNLLLQNSENRLAQQLETLQSGHSLQIPEFESTRKSLTQLTAWAKLDLYALNVKDRHDFTKEFCPRKDSKLGTLDKIDFILQNCLLQVRSIKESEPNYSADELRSLKFSLENAIDGIENLGKLTSPLKPTEATPETDVEIPNTFTGNELIVPTSNPLDVPQSEEVIFEGISQEENPLVDNTLHQKEEYINTGATRTVLKELKCVLANKHLLKREDSNDNKIPLATETTLKANDASCKDKSESFQPTSAQSLLNFAILNSPQNSKLTQTVIGDSSDSD